MSAGIKKNARGLSHGHSHENSVKMPAVILMSGAAALVIQKFSTKAYKLFCGAFGWPFIPCMQWNSVNSEQYA